MTLKEKINADYISAFKSKDIIGKSILSVIKGEIQTQEKNLVKDLDDADVTKILFKISKSLNETISASGDEESKRQLEIVSNYLPKQMSREDIEFKISSMISENSAIAIGDVMKAFATDPVDRKVVSEIFQKLKI